ncbi:tetratricopeptide repeat protein [Pseudomonas sp. C27(2019)]|uniref:YfgM family protein n=1 Tax=Pseudomonas sp. C27(2019) TaxID=2604941 RepID=UPI001248DA83|nr:tetratricopeptide repeat protein [Pseudomonas sp. C27(2019)]QEY58365.1 tetratricopeptide repeat protein [Pseudomonas sp. C27(2019)]
MSDHTEEEQIALIKEWWQRNGKPLLMGGVLALVIVFGWQTWQKHQANQAHTSSVLYQQLLEAALVPSEQIDAQHVAKLLAEIKKVNPDNAYAQYAGLLAVKVAVDKNQLDDAALELNEILAKPANDTLQELARQRLARVLIAQEQAEQALKLLDAKVQPAFIATREELRGDALVVLERPVEAKAAYLNAQKALSPEAAAGNLLMKLDNLSDKDA